MSLPPLPSHPERLTQRWSEEEAKVLQAYGQTCREQALEEAINCYSPDDTASSYIEKIGDLK